MKRVHYYKIYPKEKDYQNGCVYAAIIGQIIRELQASNITGEKRFVADLRVFKKGICLYVSENIYAPTRKDAIKLISKSHKIGGYGYEILSLTRKGYRREWNDNEFQITKSGKIIYLKDILTGMIARFDIKRKELSYITEYVYQNAITVDVSRSLTLIEEYITGRYGTYTEKETGNSRC
jgi:hypothetical protein